MNKYALALVLVLTGCEIKPLLAPIERAVVVVDNSLSNFIRVSRVARAGDRVYLAGVGLWQRSGDFSWEKVGSLPMSDPTDEPVVDIIGVGNDLWMASSKAIYQRSGGSWKNRGGRSDLRFGEAFFTANGKLVLSDPTNGASVFNTGTESWDKISVDDPVALVYQGGAYVLATSGALWRGTDLASLTKLTTSGLPDPPNMSDLVAGGGNYYLAANGAIYKGTSLNSWTLLGGSSVGKITKVENFLLATRSVGGFGVLNIDSGTWSTGGGGDGFSDPDSFAVQAGDQKLDDGELTRFVYDKPASGDARVYALSKGAHGMYAAHFVDNRWRWERE